MFSFRSQSCDLRLNVRELQVPCSRTSTLSFARYGVSYKTQGCSHADADIPTCDAVAATGLISAV